MKKYILEKPFDISTTSYGGSQMWYTNKRNLNTGCGPIALMNIFSYYNDIKFEKEDLLKFQDKVQDYLKGPVISPEQFINGARRLFNNYGFDVSYIKNTAFLLNSKSFLNIQNQIKDSLSQGRPIALLIGPSIPFLKDEYKHDFRNHWVLITEYDENTLEKDDLLVSSWGEQFNLNLTKLKKSKLFISTVTLIPYKVTSSEDDIKKIEIKDLI